MHWQCRSFASHSVDSPNRNTHYYAWRWLLEGRYESPEVLTFFESVFDKEGAADLFEFSRVHQAVLGFFGPDIEDLISESRAEINHEDRDGKTALEWALKREESEIAKMLLKYGAKAKPDELHRYFRCGGVDLDGITMFCKAGADFNHVGADGESVFHSTCSEGRQQILEYFIAHGADLESVTEDDDKNTPLSIAAGNSGGDLSTVLLLLDAGATVQGAHGLKALVAAITSNNNDILRFLLERGINHIGNLRNPVPVDQRSPPNHQSDDWWYMESATIVHVAAYFANIEAFQILASAQLIGLDHVVDDMDKLGYTARDYLWFRLHPREHMNCYESSSDGDSDFSQRVQELDSDDNNDDEDYEPSEEGSDDTASTDGEHGGSVITNDINDEEDEDQHRLLTEAFEAFLNSLKRTPTLIDNRDDEDDQFFDAYETPSR